MGKVRLESALEAHGVPDEVDRVVAECGDCGAVLYDVPKRNNPPIHAASYISSEIEIRARRHQQSEGHLNLDVAIDKKPTVEREIDCEITVNEHG